MSKQAETLAHNTAHLNAHLAQQAEANVTGGECPKCGGGVNPTILANFGHCLTCQRAAYFGA